MNIEVFKKKVIKYYQKYNKYFPTIGTIIIMLFYLFPFIKYLSIIEILPRVILYSVGSLIIKKLIPLSIIYLLGVILILISYNNLITKKKKIKKNLKTHLTIIRILSIIPYIYIFIWSIINTILKLLHIVEIPKFIIFIFDIIELSIGLLFFLDLFIIIRLFIKKYNLDIWIKKKLLNTKKK